MSPIRILLVDDHKILREGLRALFGHQPDFDIVGETSGAEQALRQTESLSPDIVLLDVEMADGSGLTVIGEIRQRSPSSKVVVLTMRDDEIYVRTAIASGASGYVLKTSSYAVLLRALRLVSKGRSYLNAPLSPTMRADVLSRRPLDRGGRPSVTTLSAREQQVFRRLVRGWTNREIADQLDVSIKTIETYRARIYDKLGLRSRAALVKYAEAVDEPSSENDDA